MLSQDMLDRLEQLRLHIHGKAQGGGGGTRASRVRGVSAEFSDYRDYAPGDDIRRIDWNAYARLDRLYLKQFMEEQENICHILLDCSRSMEDKWQNALETAEALAYLALLAGDRVRIVCLRGKETRPGPLYHTRRSFEQVCAYLESCACDGKDGVEAGVLALRELPRGMSLLISDCLQPVSMDRSLKWLQFMRQETVLIQILADAEVHPELEGHLNLVDSESGEKMAVTVDRQALEAYLRTLEGFLADTAESCRLREIPRVLLDGGDFHEKMLSGLRAAQLL